MRLTLLTEIPAPFRGPLFNELAGRGDVDLDVVFLAEHDPRRRYVFYRQEAHFRWHVLRGIGIARRGLWIVVNRRVGRTLRNLDPDVLLLGGWNQPAFWQAIAFARRRRCGVLTWVESTQRDARSGNPTAEAAKRAFIRRSDAFVVPGSAAAEYIETFGVPRDRIFVAPNAVDLDIFGERVAAARTRRDALRRELGLDGFVVLSVGRLEPEKGHDILVRAMADVPGTLAIVGSGSLEQQLRRAAPAGRTRFVGHLERDDLVSWYAAADAFVLPSRSDTWGMVLNEAAAAGLPIVATDVAGASHDLVDHGVSGFRVPTEDADALAAALRSLAQHETLRARAGERSLELAEAFTPAAWAAAVAAAASYAACAR